MNAIKLSLLSLIVVIFASILFGFFLGAKYGFFPHAGENSIQKSANNLVLLTQGLSPTEIKQKIDPEKLLSSINDYRGENDLFPLKKSEEMCKIAEKRLPEIVQNFSHEGFQYFRFCTNCKLSESIAKGFNTEDEVLEGWIDSENDLSRLRSDFTHTCIKTDDTYVVMIYGYF